MSDHTRVRAAGVPISVHWSALLMLLMMTWLLADGYLPHAAPGRSTATYWLGGLVGAALLLCSLMAHEVAHALVARREGVRVEGLTFWLFGGIARLDGQPPTPGSALRIAAVGPGVSLALALGAGLVWRGLLAAGAGDVAVGIAGWLAALNLVLAVFNLVPGAPLDGGRILQAVLWWHRGDRTSAAISAARAGQVVAYGLIGLGVVSFLGGDPVGGLWMVLISSFLMSAAKAERTSTVTERYLGDITASEAMSSPVETVDAASTVAEVVDRHILHGRHAAFPVVDVDGRVTGLVTLRQLRAVPAEQRGTRPVGEVAVPITRVVVCAPDDALVPLLRRSEHETGGRALVLDRGRLEGIITPSDVARLMASRELVAAGT